MIAISHEKESDWSGASIFIKDAVFETPFETGVEYSSPARGPWNIVHTGMLMPESHQIFVCAQSCLRGVVLTAAEMNAEERFSTITIEEHNILDGDMEKLIIDGVADILHKLPVRPRAILLFTSCIHHFVGCDLRYVYDTLHKQFPDIDITDCYMNPTMRKTLTPPDVKMRQQLYSVLHETSIRDNGINFIGNNFPTLLDGELGLLLQQQGCIVRDICTSKTYDEFQKMAQSKVNITTNPAAFLAGETISKRFGTKHLVMPLSYDYDEINAALSQLYLLLSEKKVQNISAKDSLSSSCIDCAALAHDADKALAKTAELLGTTQIAIDYTATSRPLGLAKLLLTHGMNVTAVYADNFISSEKNDFDFLKNNFPMLRLYATVHPKMAILPAQEKSYALHDSPSDGSFTLAIGQKAAYFTGTRHFVNMIEANGFWGYSGISHLMELIQDAYKNEKDTAKIIQVKGWGCCA